MESPDFTPELSSSRSTIQRAESVLAPVEQRQEVFAKGFSFSDWFRMTRMTPEERREAEEQLEKDLAARRAAEEADRAELEADKQKYQSNAAFYARKARTAGRLQAAFVITGALIGLPLAAGFLLPSLIPLIAAQWAVAGALMQFGSTSIVYGATVLSISIIGAIFMDIRKVIHRNNATGWRANVQDVQEAQNAQRA